MRYFPQLNSGATAQFPFEKTVMTRTVVNETWSGDRVTFDDEDAARTKWKLEFRGLTGDEWDRLRELFMSAKGRLGTFVFLDPAANLLAWSEDVTQGSWVLDPLLAAAAGIADPWGGTRAARLTSSAAVWQGAIQSLPVAGTFQYSLSAWVRSAAGSAVRLIRGVASQSVFREEHANEEWRRISLGGSPAADVEEVRFGISVPAGGVVEVAGLQVEAQLSPSAYKKTAAKNGVHLSARFDQDDLRLLSNSFEDLSAVVELVSR